MKIGIDARPLAMTKTGIGACIVSLVEYLLKQEDIECILFTDRELKYKFESHSNVKVEAFSASRRVIWEQLLLPGRINRQKLDLYHATWNYGLPARLSRPAVLTVHDLIPLVLSDYFPSWRDRVFYQSVYRWSLEISVRKAQVILADSENSKKDIHALLRVPLSRIKVVPQGLSRIYDSPPSRALIEQSLGEYALTGDYVIYTGGFDRRKNIDRLLEAFAQVLRSHKRKLRLVLTGEKNFLCPQIERKGKELGIEDRMVFVGYVSDEDMPLLIAGARMLVYPSLYEGFGFPPLEAMACGTPVIASNISTIPEIVGDAGILVDPHSVEEMSDAMLRLLEDEELRRKLATRGLKRAQLFKAEDNAKRTLAVYRELLASSRKRIGRT